MRAKITPSKIWMLVAILAAMLPPISHSAFAQTDNAANRTKVLRAAADALGMVRWSDIGAGPIHLPGIDAVNTMDIRATGTVGQSADAEYHVALAYNPPAMRVEITRKGASAGQSQHTIQTVREKYAWNESEIGAGLEPGKGTATPAMADQKERLLQLWILPYGVVKAALAAGDKTIVSTENGATVITFPLSGSLADVTVKATLDSKNLVSKVETRSDNRSPGESGHGNGILRLRRPWRAFDRYKIPRPHRREAGRPPHAGYPRQGS